jgi:hypothetical protein
MQLELARALSMWPTICRSLVQEHRAGPDGRCLGCRSQVRLAPRWPCNLFALADAALRLIEQRHIRGSDTITPLAILMMSADGVCEAGRVASPRTPSHDDTGRYL